MPLTTDNNSEGKAGTGYNYCLLLEMSNMKRKLKHP